MIRQTAKEKPNLKALPDTPKETSKLRAVGYNRTSGGGQRDNTSIPRQKEEIEKFVARERWDFIRHYVDESKSGAKIDGRDDFKQMLKDAANREFDFIVIYDISRFARDGSDIIGTATFLKKNFGVHVIDTKGGFDTRELRNVMMNFVRAGVAEDEKLSIMERCIGGRIKKAKDGLLWSGNPPAGRAFRSTGKNSGEWFVTEEGQKLGELLRRYADGEPLKALAKEYGFLCPSVITRNIHKSQLSGVYRARFHAPEIGIDNLMIPVPAIPEIITAELEKRVKERSAHNQRCNKQGKRKYLLTGFVKCSHCNHSLIAQCNRSLKSQKSSSIYYRHYESYATSGKNCPYCSIRSDVLESQVLDYLYNFFLDEPTYNEAVKRALPSDDDRKALEKDIKEVERQLVKIDNRITNLVNAIADGADVKLLLDKQTSLKAEKQALESRRDELNQTLVTMPNPEHIKGQAMLLRIALIEQHKGKDWRTLPYEDVRRFLHFLFSDNPFKNGYGIFVNRINGKWHITFKGSIEFYYDIIDGRPVSHILQIEAETLNRQIKRAYVESVREAEKVRELALRDLTKESSHPVDFIKPFNDNQ